MLSDRFIFAVSHNANPFLCEEIKPLRNTKFNPLFLSVFLMDLISVL